MDFVFKDGCTRPEDVRVLFEEYTDALLRQKPDFAGYLGKQNYAAELAHPQEKYGAPAGRLYLAEAEGKLAGCIALRRINDADCELKRLYVREEFRRSGLGEMLSRQLIADAKAVGYKRMLLDTFPFLESAIRLYKRLGFYEIESYNNTPMGGMIYLCLDL